MDMENVNYEIQIIFYLKLMGLHILSFTLCVCRWCILHPGYHSKVHCYLYSISFIVEKFSGDLSDVKNRVGPDGGVRKEVEYFCL